MTMTMRTIRLESKGGGKPPHSEGFSTGARGANRVREGGPAGGKLSEDSAHAAETDGRAIGNHLAGANRLIVHSRPVFAAQIFDFGAVAENVNHRVPAGDRWRGNHDRGI